MALVDKSLILRKVSEIETYKNQIGEFSNITTKEYRENWKTQRIVERTLQMMIEICVDISNHIISEGKMRVPVSYADTFKILHENSVIDSELLDTMEKMAKFRNIVVHQYEEVDSEIVVLILKKYLGDFERFKEAILDYLKKQR
jgi:uncharacterized protein YutE (UPF0331/DUF86 family)